jgi:hypothetical protein
MNQEEYVEELKQYQQAYRNVLSSTDGKRMLEHLQKLVQGKAMFDPDPLKMAYNAAQYELLELIKDMGKQNAD